MVGEDGRQAAEHGAQGVIVSNHGARSLDTTLATIDALPELVEAVAGQAEVSLDGGIRRGTDVFKALARGARAVLIGRPVFGGLAVAGETGVRLVLERLRDEFDATMGMCGRTTVASVDRECLVGVSPFLAVFPPAAPFRERTTPHAGWRKLGVVKDRVDAQQGVHLRPVREAAGRRHGCSRGARAFPLAE
jgi:hypothetical protein